MTEQQAAAQQKPSLLEAKNEEQHQLPGGQENFCENTTQSEEQIRRLIKDETSSLIIQMENINASQTAGIKALMTKNLKSSIEMNKKIESITDDLDKRVTQLEASNASKALTQKKLALSDRMYEEDLQKMMTALKAKFDTLTGNITRVVLKMKQDLQAKFKTHSESLKQNVAFQNDSYEELASKFEALKSEVWSRWHDPVSSHQQMKFR